MIPPNISRNHVLKAIKEISQNGIPRRRQSKDFTLTIKGKAFPPKYTISLANKYANGVELDPAKFSGGHETNSLLTSLGFTISHRISAQSETKHRAPPKRPSRLKAVAKHNERCPACKETVRVLLENIYGEVYSNRALGFGTTPEDFRGLPFFETLQEIYCALHSFRGYTDFVHSQSLPPVDYFIPPHGPTIEFDESQHFTACRKLTLSKYPKELLTGFDKDRWAGLCDEIGAKDNKPAYRDEQRAWYDTLRDFAPVMRGQEPTIRLYARDFAWCRLNPDNETDIKTFKGILAKSMPPWDIEVKMDPTPKIARIVIAGNWPGNPKETKRLLKSICDRWPLDKKVNFLISPGGFLQFDWPTSLSKSNVGNCFNPNDKILSELLIKATQCAQDVLDDDICSKLANVTRYITLGIDSSKKRVSTTQNYIGQLHTELLLIVDLKDRTFHWTGKSYPTNNQAGRLVRFPSLDTHFLELSGVGSVMILGCHDLTIFNNRNLSKTKGLRKEIKMTFRRLAKQRKPVVVIQHPHTTDSIRTWSAAWNGLRAELPSVEAYASSGAYYNAEGERSDIIKVLNKTKLGDTIDFIVRTHGGNK